MPSKIVITSKRDPRVTVDYSVPKSSVSFADLKASAFLDADSLHRWLYDTYAFSDAPEIGFSKTADADTFTFADSEVISFGKAPADTFGFSDSVLTQLTFFRTFSDTFTLDDITAVDAVRKDVASDKTNIFGFSDDQAIGVGKGLSDTFAFSEAIDSFGIGKGLTDSQPMTELLARSVQYVRTFTDTFVMDDAATVDALQKLTSALKQNIVSIGDVFGRTVVFNRQFADSFNPTEAHAVSLDKAAADDSFNVFESFDRSVSYSRSFSDSQGFADEIDSFGIGKGLADSQTMTESHASAVSIAKSDSFSMSEQASSLTGKALADALSVAESLSRAVTYNRTFTDAFSMDDAATVNALVKDHANTKTNVFTFADSQTFGFGKAATDTFSFADDEDFAFGKGLSDSVTVTENFSFALFSNAAMNAAQLNLSPFNE